MSYWLAATARGRGVTTRAVRLLSRWAFDHLRLAELRLWTDVDNVASRRVAERAGYRRDPERDGVRQVKGLDRQTVAYRLEPDLAGAADAEVDASFSRALRGYDPEQVDALLRQAGGALVSNDGGRLAAARDGVERADLRLRWFHGYDREQVDALLTALAGRLATALGELDGGR